MVVDVSFWSFTLASCCFRFISRSFHTVSRTPLQESKNSLSGGIYFLSDAKVLPYEGSAIRSNVLYLLNLEIHDPCLAANSKKHNCTTKRPAKKTIFVVTHPFGRSRWFAAISRSFHVPVWLFHVVSHSYHTNFTLFPEPPLPNQNLIIESHLISHQNQVHFHKMKVRLSDVILCTFWSSQCTNRAWQHNTIAKQNAQQISTSTTGYDWHR